VRHAVGAVLPGLTDYPEGRQLTETANHLRIRHLKWIDLNLKVFAEDAPKMFREHGRGAIIATAAPGPPGLVPLEYWTQVEDLPDDEAGLRILAMIQQYDPDKQFVVVVREPDYGVHAYVVGLR
jgi:hypothetical protein